jgi:choline dehydrogenase-like flavoprotein
MIRRRSPCPSPSRSCSLFGAGSADDVALYQQGRGPLTSNIVEGGVFLSTCGDERTPDCQFEMAPVLYFDEGLSAPVDHAFTLTTTLVKPTSRGRVASRSARPDAKPRISHNYLATEHESRHNDRRRPIGDGNLPPAGAVEGVARTLLCSCIRRGRRTSLHLSPRTQVATITRRAPARSAALSVRISEFSVPKDCVWSMRR